MYSLKDIYRYRDDKIIRSIGLEYECLSMTSLRTILISDMTSFKMFDDNSYKIVKTKVFWYLFGKAESLGLKYYQLDEREVEVVLYLDDISMVVDLYLIKEYHSILNNKQFLTRVIESLSLAKSLMPGEPFTIEVNSYTDFIKWYERYIYTSSCNREDNREDNNRLLLCWSGAISNGYAEDAHVLYELLKSSKLITKDYAYVPVEHILLLVEKGELNTKKIIGEILEMITDILINECDDFDVDLNALKTLLRMNFYNSIDVVRFAMTECPRLFKIYYDTLTTSSYDGLLYKESDIFNELLQDVKIKYAYQFKNIVESINITSNIKKYSLEISDIWSYTINNFIDNNNSDSKEIEQMKQYGKDIIDPIIMSNIIKRDNGSDKSDKN